VEPRHLEVLHAEVSDVPTAMLSVCL
jgi:hypothetical protein